MICCHDVCCALLILNLRNSQMADLLIDAFLRQDLLSLLGLSGLHISHGRCYEDMMLQGYCNCSNLLAKFLAKWRPRTSFMINKILTIHHRALAPRARARARPVGILQMSCAVSGVIFSTERRNNHSSSRRFPLSRCGEFTLKGNILGEKRRGGRGRKGEQNFTGIG